MGRSCDRGVHQFSAWIICFLSASSLSGCLVDSVCYGDSDCGEKNRCEAGRCVDISCHTPADCRDDEVCNTTLGVCEKACPHGDTPLDCPKGMVSIEDAFCLDVYEASRPDATVVEPGTDGSRATSRAGVIPWQAENAEAQAACEAAGKDLCTEREWGCACRGPSQTVYAYGDDYDPTICNGIDTFCLCEGACGSQEPCPFPGCYHICGAAFHVTPTGDKAGCLGPYGAYDLNGNVWEHVKGGNNTRVRGGAFNCSDSKKLHRCDYIPGTWTPSARGFRCCWRPGEVS